MKICENIEAIDLGLYLQKEKVLIIADLHLGYEEYLAKRGVLVPRTQYKQTIKRLAYIFSKLPVKTIVLNGDVKHEFGAVNPQEWREVLKLIDYLEKKGKLVVIKGNHDTILGPITKKREINEVKEYRIGDVLIAHGDYIPAKLAKIMIIGHEHPAVTLREEAKTEKFKCYLKGKYKRSMLIVQPSFNLLTQGTDVTRERLLSPFLKNIEDFQCYVVNDQTHEVLEFGKVGEL
ncbi:metallophosphoesterase [Candidatus Woesearchaeota archaeon]|nr:metallophosphoesterase [Candidatus Woesearchaeota archaeon]